MTRCFSLDNQTAQKIKEEAHKMRLNQTKFMQFLVWQHVNNSKKDPGYHLKNRFKEAVEKLGAREDEYYPGEFIVLEPINKELGLNGGFNVYIKDKKKMAQVKKVLPYLIDKI